MFNRAAFSCNQEPEVYVGLPLFSDTDLLFYRIILPNDMKYPNSSKYLVKLR